MHNEKWEDIVESVRQMIFKTGGINETIAQNYLARLDAEWPTENIDSAAKLWCGADKRIYPYNPYNMSSQQIRNHSFNDIVSVTTGYDGLSVKSSRYPQPFNFDYTNDSLKEIVCGFIVGRFAFKKRGRVLKLGWWG